MKPPKLITSNILDPQALLNFERISEFLLKHPFSRMSGEFREFGLINAADQKIQHKLSFTPKDVILLHNSNTSASVSFNYAKFDETFLYVTSNAVTNVRIIVGRYE